MNIKRKQIGLTLIELMIALILGLFVSLAIMTIFFTNVKSTTETVRMIQLNQELRSAMSFISDEVKRAGYSADGDEDYMGAWDTSTANCVIYAYDQNADGSTYAAASDRFGFRLNNNEIQWGQSVTSCAGTGWQPLTDVNVANITTFTITSNPIAAGTLTINQIDISITGQIMLNAETVSRDINETIRVRNEDAT